MAEPGPPAGVPAALLALEFVFTSQVTAPATTTTAITKLSTMSNRLLPPESSR
ncbi:MAG: hypothetical protein ABWZ98_08565 [Nakamurella sp.]